MMMTEIGKKMLELGNEIYNSLHSDFYRLHT